MPTAQLSLSHIPDNRYFIGRLVRTLHCKRRYQSWCHPHTLCHYAKKSRLKPHNMYTSVIASSITIGFGGSVGAEAPIVYTGAAIGSNIGRLFRLDQRLLMLLVGCGAAAAIAGIFKAPIAGILFTLEVLMIDMTATSVLPLLISSITAVTVSYIFTGYNAEFSFVQTEPFVAARIPYVIFLGFFCGFVSLYFTAL